MSYESKVSKLFDTYVDNQQNKIRTYLVILAVRNIVLLVNIGCTYVRIYNIVILANKQYSTGIIHKTNLLKIPELGFH